MQTMTFEFDAKHRANGDRETVIVGVVASGNLEALFERNPALHQVSDRDRDQRRRLRRHLACGE